MQKDKTVIILAGGKSRRMGCHKAFLNLDGQTFIEGILSQYSDYAERIIVTNDPNIYRFEGVVTLKDRYQDMGPLCGIYTGLAESKSEISAVVTVDSPFLPSVFMDYLIEEACDADAVVPRFDGRLYPLCAAYNKSALIPIKEALLGGERKVMAVYERLNAKFVEAREISRFGDPQRLLLNINTPHDYRQSLIEEDCRFKGR